MRAAELLQTTLNTFGSPGRFAYEVLVVAARAARGFGAGRVLLRAAALTYLTLVSLVPMLAVVLALLQAFALDALRGAVTTFLYENLAVGAREALARHLAPIVENANHGGVRSVGFLLLLGSAFLLLRNIEKAFDDLWGISSTRSLLRQLPRYLGLLIAGPVALGTSIVLTAAVRSYTALHELPVPRELFALAPFLTSALGFSILYKLAPAARVRLRAALVGGLLAALLFESAKLLYGGYAASAMRTNAIYGSLGALPLFFVWVYVSWLITLFGARVAYAVQHPGSLLLADDQEAARFEELCAARIAIACARLQAAGEPSPSLHALAVGLSAPEGLVRSAVASLEEAQILRVTRRRIELAREARSISLGDVLAAIRGQARPSTSDDALTQTLARLLADADDAAVRALHALDLASLSADPTGRTAPAGPPLAKA